MPACNARPSYPTETRKKEKRAPNLAIFRQRNVSVVAVSLAAAAVIVYADCTDEIWRPHRKERTKERWRLGHFSAFILKLASHSRRPQLPHTARLSMRSIYLLVCLPSADLLRKRESPLWPHRAIRDKGERFPPFAPTKGSMSPLASHKSLDSEVDMQN